METRKNGPTGVNTHALNQINGSRVLRTIWLTGAISRIEIARRLNLNKSTVTKIVSDLMASGILKVVAEGEASPQGGRKPKYLSIDTSFGCVLGVEIMTDSWVAVGVDLDGTIIHSEKHPVSDRTIDTVELFLEIVGELRETLARLGYRTLGVALGVSGIVDVGAGVICQSIPLLITDPLPLRERVSGRLDIPVMVENDANCGCWGELAMREGERHGNFLFVLGEFRPPNTRDFDFESIAVGLGFVIGGTVHHGRDHSAGEFRSILWERENTTQFSMTDDDFDRVRTDRHLYDQVFQELCRHVAFLVNTLNLSAVILGGAIDFTQEHAREVLRREIQGNWSYANDVECEIRISNLGDQVVAYGAAGMFLEHLFALPDISGNMTGLPTGLELLEATRAPQHEHP